MHRKQLELSYPTPLVNAFKGKSPEELLEKFESEEIRDVLEKSKAQPSLALGEIC
jgi:hypothetical protein